MPDTPMTHEELAEIRAYLADEPNTSDPCEHLNVHGYARDLLAEVAALKAELAYIKQQNLELTHRVEVEDADVIERLQAQLAAYPEKCPVTGRPFFMVIDHPSLGPLATYGGPYDSYTIPSRDGDDQFSGLRFDHDEGRWVDGTDCTGLFAVPESALCDAEELEELRAENKKLRKEIEAQLAALRKRKAIYKKQLNESRLVMQRQADRIRTLSKENARLQESNAWMEQVRKTLRAKDERTDPSALTKKIADQRRTIRLLNNRLEAANLERKGKASFQREHAKALDKVHVLSKKLRQKSDENSALTARLAASVPREVAERAAYLAILNNSASNDLNAIAAACLARAEAEHKEPAP